MEPGTEGSLQSRLWLEKNLLLALDTGELQCSILKDCLCCVYKAFNRKRVGNKVVVKGCPVD